MKKFIYITIFLTLISCQNDDMNMSDFNPPEWLIGTWDNSYETAHLKTYFITNNNVILEDKNGDLNDYRESVNESSDISLIELDITETLYRYTINTKRYDGEILKYKVTFIKVSNNEIEQIVTIPTSTTSSIYYRRN